MGTVTGPELTYLENGDPKDWRRRRCGYLPHIRVVVPGDATDLLRALLLASLEDGT